MRAAENCVPRSWLLTFTDSSDEVTAQCYLHTSDYAPQGWYPKFDRVIKLSKQFKMPLLKAGISGKSGSNRYFLTQRDSILDG